MKKLLTLLLMGLTTVVVTAQLSGDLDNTFLSLSTGANNEVEDLALQPDGKVLIGGNFTTYNGVARGGIARLNADGSLDNTFLNSGAGVEIGSIIKTLTLQPDGKILIGGNFTTYNGVVRGGIARLNTDGSLDNTFLNAGAGANDLVF